MRKKKCGKDLHIKLSTEERAVLERKAMENHQTMTDYICTLILARPIQYPQVLERMDRIIYEVNRIGNNINQIAHHENAGIFDPEDIAELKEYRVQLEEQVFLLKQSLMKSGGVSDGNYKAYVY